MKLSGLLSLAFAVAGVTAAPALEERQQLGVFLIQFYSQPDCQGPLQDSQGFIQTKTAGVCQAADAGKTDYPSFRVRVITQVTAPVTIFSEPECSGQSVTLAPDTPIFTCVNQTVGSGKF